eukprot:89955_1
MSRDRQQYGLSNTGVITEEVRKFLLQFRDNVARGSAKLLYSSYTSFKSITEKTYQVSTWPSDRDVVTDLKLDSTQESTKIFLYLYRELFYRHAFNRCDITCENMHDSFTNYMRLFNALLNHYDKNKKFCEIPNVWLWDMIDSFVSQFQYYHHWRADPKDQHKNMQTLIATFANTSQQKSFKQKWNVQIVLRYLHYFVHAARIPIRYNEPNQQPQQGVPVKTPSIMMQMLGFFSLIGLSRIHTLLGDYRTAIDVMDPVDLKTKSAITKFASCCISAHYYLSFSYCMVRRFPDAHAMLCTLLRNPRYAEKTGKGKRTRFLFTDVDDEKDHKTAKGEAADQELSDKDRYHKAYLSNEAMLDRSWAMLAIAQTQSPTKLDEVLLGTPLRDYFGGDMDDINDNSSSTERRKASYAKLFQASAPNFLNTFSPFKTDAESAKLAQLSGNELCNNQFRSFMRLTNKRQDMLKVKNEIRLFRVIPMTKLAKAMNYEENEIGKLNRELIRLKWRMKQNKKVDSWGNTKDQFTFYIKDDCVYVQELQTSQLWKYSDYFIRNTQTITDWIENYPTHL